MIEKAMGQNLSSKDRHAVLESVFPDLERQDDPCLDHELMTIFMPLKVTEQAKGSVVFKRHVR